MILEESRIIKKTIRYDLLPNFIAIVSISVLPAV